MEEPPATRQDSDVDHHRWEIRIPRRGVTRILTVALVAVLAGNVVGHLAAALETTGDAVWIRLASLDGENTVPTWMSAVVLLIAAALCWVIARHEAAAGGRWRRHWAGLGLMLLAFSVDEVASFHEAFSHPIREALDLDGILYYAWVVPALGAVAIVAGLYARFAVQLPARVRWRVVAAGALFVAGAIGMEMVGTGPGGGGGTGYVVAMTAEEALEIGAVILLIDALLLYLGSERWRFAWDGGAGLPSPPVPPTGPPQPETPMEASQSISSEARRAGESSIR